MQSESDRKEIKILIIEDDKAYALLLGKMLKRVKNVDFVIEHVENLQSASERIAKGNIDIILLDLYLPDGYGLDMIDAIRASVYNIPVVLLTSLDDEMIGIKALQKGAQDYLVKANINYDLLGRSILHAIERHNLLTRLRRNAKALEASEERFRRITEQNTDAIIVIDHEGLISFINPAGEALFEKKSEDLINKPFGFPTEIGEKSEVEIPRETGQPIIAEMRVAKIEWHNREAKLISLRDITERKQVEKLKEEVISIVSHELRSPLTSIINSLSLIAEGEAGEITEQTKKLINIAFRSSERMLRLANDMLDIRKIESGNMEFHLQIHDLMPIIEQSIEANRAYAKQFDVDILLENYLPDIKVNVDSDRFMQIMTNLLTNAAKFSPKGEKVVVSVTSNGDWVRVSVKDKGPGIPDEFRNRIFDKFAQAQLPGIRKKDSSGLGLSITKMLVEYMGGTIGFDTRINEGTTFFFDFPKYNFIVPK